MSTNGGPRTMTEFHTPACIVCHLTSIVELDTEKFDRWKGGEHVQNVWPEKSPDERERLMTGIHAECWKEIFGGSE